MAVAAYHTMLVAADAIKCGGKNSEVTAAVERVASSYGVTPIASVRMHQMKRFVIDVGCKRGLGYIKHLISNDLSASSKSFLFKRCMLFLARWHVWSAILIFDFLKALECIC